jgi:hypothetical protein
MQVTDGKHRGKYLQSTTSEKVRPTARRIREVMFRILYRRIPRRQISGFMRRRRNGRHRSDFARRVNRHVRRAFGKNVRLYQEKFGNVRH